MVAETFIIQGVTSKNSLFHPADWADRLAGCLSTVQMRRLRYSPYLYPTIYEGYRSLYVHGALKNINEGLYQDLRRFAQENTLRIIPIE